MAKIDLSLGETKSEIALSNESKSSSMTWDEANMTWDEQDGTWAQPEYVLSKESKSEITLDTSATTK